MKTLFANRNSHRDFVTDAIDALSDPPCNVYIAVAFFTDASVVESLITRGCHVRLVVRLGFPTNARALDRLTKYSTNLEVRYFTDISFHPKIYIFGSRSALVGSANLTQAALKTNQEVVIKLGADDERLRDLAVVFAAYWAEAKVLTSDVLRKYDELCGRYQQLWRSEIDLAEQIKKQPWSAAGQNIGREHPKASKENVFLEDFRKAYQEGLSAFNVIRGVFQDDGRRKVAEHVVPLRLEIDSFVSYVREEHAYEDQWMSTTLTSGTEQKERIQRLVGEWHNTKRPYFEEKIAHENYPRLLRIFASPNAIANASDEELFEALCCVHSFYDRFRFFDGGLLGWKKTFLNANDPQKLRSSLAYLLFGPGKAEERMADLIFNPTFKLNEFGQSNVQELVGWLNSEDLPVINGRTTKVMRYFGFDVEQLG